MGCDYYILKKLHIYFAENEYLDIEINRERGYYHDDGTIDSDDENAEDLWNEYVRFTLTPKIKPIVLYDGKKWNIHKTETKYKKLIETAIQEHKIAWEQILQIVKIEKREVR